MLLAGRGSEKGRAVCRIGLGDQGRAVQQCHSMMRGRGQSSLPWRDSMGKVAQGSPEVDREGRSSM